jgi:hypothetical protein
MIVSIIDANVYDFEFWRYNEHWEHSGFGITTVILKVQTMFAKLLRGQPSLPDLHAGQQN